MIPLFSLRGYTAYDPLDDAPDSIRYLLTMGCTALLSVLLLFIVFNILHIATLHYSWLFWVECTVITFLYAPLITSLRKSSSLVHIGLLMVVALPLDLFIEAHYRLPGRAALWTYNHDTFLGFFHPLIRMSMVWLGDAIICGSLALWVARLTAGMFVEKKAYSSPEQEEALFPDQWIEEQVEEPVHDAGYYILRIVGFAYLSYFLLCLIGLSGASPWPGPIRTMLDMTYANPTLAINTFAKLTLMIVLAFLGAHNVQLRWHCSLALLVGHSISTVASLFFYFYAPTTDYYDFLLASAVVDGVMCILFIWIMIRYKDYAHAYTRPAEFPEFYSLPHRLTTIFYYTFGIVTGLFVPGIVCLRLFLDASSGWGAVYGYPDPQVCNVLTRYATVSFLSFMMAKREALREQLYKAILWPCSVGVIASMLCLLVGGMIFTVPVRTRTEALVNVDWYYMLNVAMDGGVVLLFLGLRKMFYDVDYSISSMSASSSQNVAALHDALYAGDTEDHSTIVQSIDRHVGDVRGRKRGLLNFPFWLVEHVFVMLYGVHIGYSSMDRAHRRSFLRQYVLRPPRERASSFVPELAEQVYKIGTAVHALTTLGHFSQSKHRANIGYVPADARDRLQGDYPSARPPFTHIAPLPTGPLDPANDKPHIPPPHKPLIAPRVSTPVGIPSIPDEVDYVIVGSGAGGAVMAYRLSCDTKSVLLLERGPRYSALQDFNDNELEMVRKLYKEGGLQQTKRFDLTVLQGECVGGSTVINNAICFRMPERVRNRWQNEYDIDLSDLSHQYDSIADELEIGPLDPLAVNAKVEDAFRAGLAGYNRTIQNGIPFVPEILEANHRNNMGSGLCNLGNRYVRKRSMLETYIPWAEARGANILGDNSAVRFSAKGRSATSVMVRTTMGMLKTIHVRKAVIIAGGVIASSHFLMRSGVQGNVGKRMSCNFAFPVAFDFPEELRAFDGVQITVGALDAQNRAIFETYFNPPGSFALSLPFYFHRHASAMNRYSYLANFGALVGSESNGMIERAPDILNGRAFAWELGATDRTNIKYALTTLVDIGKQAGAIRAFLPTEPGIELPLDPTSIERFKKALEDYPIDMNNLRLTTAHPQGGNGMYGNNSSRRALRVVDGDFRVDGFDNVFVADASLFPSTITVNPQWTIMAMSSLAAQSVLEHTL